MGEGQCPSHFYQPKFSLTNHVSFLGDFNKLRDMCIFIKGEIESFYIDITEESCCNYFVSRVRNAVSVSKPRPHNIHPHSAFPWRPNCQIWHNVIDTRLGEKFDELNMNFHQVKLWWHGLMRDGWKCWPDLHIMWTEAWTLREIRLFHEETIPLTFDLQTQFHSQERFSFFFPFVRSCFCQQPSQIQCKNPEVQMQIRKRTESGLSFRLS